MARILGVNALPAIGPLPEFHRITYRLTPAIRIEIIRLHRNGASVCAISDQLNISRPSVYRWIQRYNEERDLKVHNSRGRQRHSTEEEDFC